MYEILFQFKTSVTRVSNTEILSINIKKLCAWRHNMPRPLHAAAQLQPIPYACGAQRALLPIAVGAMNINELMNINYVCESTKNRNTKH